MGLAQTLQFAWFCGHVTLLLCTLRYGLSWITFNYYSGMAKFCYRTAFVAAAATYGIVVYKAFRARARAGKASGQQAIISMAADENVQYLRKFLDGILHHMQLLNPSPIKRHHPLAFMLTLSSQ